MADGTWQMTYVCVRLITLVFQTNRPMGGIFDIRGVRFPQKTVFDSFGLKMRVPSRQRFIPRGICYSCSDFGAFIFEVDLWTNFGADLPEPGRGLGIPQGGIKGGVNVTTPKVVLCKNWNPPPVGAPKWHQSSLGHQKLEAK